MLTRRRFVSNKKIHELADKSWIAEYIAAGYDIEKLYIGFYTINKNGNLQGWMYTNLYKMSGCYVLETEYRSAH